MDFKATVVLETFSADVAPTFFRLLCRATPTHTLSGAQRSASICRAAGMYAHTHGQTRALSHFASDVTASICHAAGPQLRIRGVLQASIAVPSAT